MSRFTEPSRAGADDDSLPPRLLEDLAGMYLPVRVPLAVDAKILNGAAAAWWRQARRFRRRLWWGGAAAAAAAAVLVVVMTLPHRQPSASPVAAAHARPGDVDHNGNVDILDAFSLARKVRDASDTPLPATGTEDVTGDGKIDAADVDRIAAWAVRVSGVPGERADRDSDR